MNPKSSLLSSLLISTPSVTIDDHSEIQALVDFINHSGHFEFGFLICNQFGHIKCLAPALDYPGLTSTYLLFPPFKIYWSTPGKIIQSKLYIPTPKLSVSGQVGESDLVLSRLKDDLIAAILKYKHLTVPPIGASRFGIISRVSFQDSFKKFSLLFRETYRI